jgi:uncharacterized protein
VRKVRRLSQWTVPLVVSGATLVALELGRRIFRIAQLFNPTRDPVLTWNPEDYGVPARQVEEIWMETADGEMLHGWYLRAEHPIASALYCHGNSGNLTNVAHLMPHMFRSGFNVLLWDYRGYGRSSGRATIGGVIADAMAAARYHDDLRPKDLPSIAFGFSLGGAVAAQVTRTHPFDGLILQSTFSSLSDIARVTFPRMPLHLVSGREFDTLRVLRALRVPLLILHGTDDEACPYWMADQMFDACNSPKLIYRVEGGLHKDLWDRDATGMIDVLQSFAATLSTGAALLVQEPLVRERMLERAIRFTRRSVRVIASAAARHAGRRQVSSC